LFVALRGWQIATVLVLLGIGLLLLSTYVEQSTRPGAVDVTVREVGALLLVTGALSVLWDLLGRRALTDNVISAANLAGNITTAGLQRVSTRYLDSDCDALITTANQGDLFFSYART
jgi:hypothetical protein